MCNDGILKLIIVITEELLWEYQVKKEDVIL